MHCRKYLQARIFKYLFLFLFSSAVDCELGSEEGGDIRFISCQSATQTASFSFRDSTVSCHRRCRHRHHHKLWNICKHFCISSWMIYLIFLWQLIVPISMQRWNMFFKWINVDRITQRTWTCICIKNYKTAWIKCLISIILSCYTNAVHQMNVAITAEFQQLPEMT